MDLVPAGPVGAPPGGETTNELPMVTSLPLVPYRRVIAEAKGENEETSLRVLAPTDEVLLLYAAQDAQSLKRLAEAGQYAFSFNPMDALFGMHGMITGPA